MIRALTTVLLGMCLTAGIRAQVPDSFFDRADNFFREHVADGRVDYKRIREQPESLDRLMAGIRDLDVTAAEPSVYKAFWINAYNLTVIHQVVIHYPLGSPLEVPGFFDRNIYRIAGQVVTLNFIENELLRARYPNEPRFHFVLVCAGLGCPPLIDRAYRPETLDMQLEEQTRLALNNPDFIRTGGKKTLVSQIFEWYGEDFKRVAGDLTEFINRYRNQPLAAGTKISFYPYDWTLNDRIR